jgi:aspartate/methionine/tyrosine aminotransferase
MKVKIHTLFQYLLETTEANPEAFIGFSLAEPPKLAEFLDDLDPDMALDWNLKSFRGLPALRSRVLETAQLQGICSPDDVLITAGAAEANYLAFMQLVEDGDEVITERPGWPQIEVLAKAQNAKVRLIDRCEDEGWALPLDALEANITPKTRLIFLTNPNNPTGRLLTGDDLTRIAKAADRVGAWVIVDEVYAGLEWTGPRPPSIAGIYGRGITAGSVSKALGLQGLRTGWMICRDPGLIMDAVILRENSSEIMNVMGETIAEIALRPDRYRVALDRARADGTVNLSMLDRFIKDEPVLSWHRPEAGLIGLARLHGTWDGDGFAKRLLANPYRTFMIPGSAYGCPNHIRVGVGGGKSANLAKGLHRLSDALRDLC